MASKYPTIDYEDQPDRSPLPTVPLPITTATDALTLTVPNLLSGIIIHSTTSDKSLTLPSASALIAALNDHAVVVAGAALDFTIIATAGNTTTLMVGAGGSILGGPDVTESGLFRLIITDLSPAAYQVVRLSGGALEYNTNPAPYTTVSNATALSATNTLRGVIIHSITTNIALTLDTAANYLTAFGPTTQVGSKFDFTIVTTPGYITTVLTGTGGSTIGSNIVDGSGRFRIQFSNVSSGTEAYLLIRLASNAPPNVTVPAPVQVTSANPGALSTSNVLAKTVLYTATSSQNVTFPTANQLVSVLGGNGIAVGTYTDLTLITTRGYILTCLAGAGGTLMGSGRIEHTGSFRFIVTNSGASTEAYQVVRHDSGEPTLKFGLNPITTTPINKSPLATSDILAQTFVYNASQNSTAQLPAASTLLTAVQSALGHVVSVGYCLEFTAIATPGYKLTLGTIDPSITKFGSLALDDSGTFRIIFTNVSLGSEAYSIIRLSGGDPNLVLCAAPVTTANNGPLTAVQLVSGTITFLQTSDQSETLPTPTDVLTELGNAGQATGVGSCVQFTIAATFPYTVTFQAPVNGTLVGSGQITSTGTFKLIITGVSPAQYVVYRMDSDTSSNAASTNFTSLGDVNHNPLTASEIKSGVILQTATTSDRTITLDTAANLVTNLPAVTGQLYDFTVVTTPQYRSIVTVAAGGTLRGTGVVTSSGRFRILFTNTTSGSEAYQLVRFDNDIHDEYPRSSSTVLTVGDNDATLTAAQIVPGRFIRQPVMTADRTLTLPSAAQIKTQLGNVVDGVAVEFTIITSQPYRSTVAVGAGGTLYGSGVVKNSATFILTITTNGTAYNLFRVDSDSSDFTRTTSAILATSSGSLTGAQLANNRVIQHSPLTPDTNNVITLPNTSSIAAAIGIATAGASFDVTILTSPSATTQLVPHAEGTLRGSGLVENSATFRFVLTGASSYDVVRLESSSNTTRTPVASSSASFTPTIAQLLSGLISHTASVPGNTETITLPTAAAIVAGIPNAIVGSSFDFAVAAIDGPKRVIVGSGGTLISGHNDIVSHASSGSYRVRLTNVTPSSETYDVFQFSAGDAPVKLTTTPPTAKDITGGVTLSVAEIHSGVISVSLGGPQTVTLPTAVAIDTTASLFVIPGSTIDFSIINASGSGGAVTVAVGTGGTANAQSILTVPVGVAGMFRLRMTSTTAYTLYRLA